MTGVAEVAFIALGSNLGDRAALLASARDSIAALEGTRLIAASVVEETAPVGDVPQGPYLKQMIAAETTLSPRTLLASLQGIELDAGRIRDVRWGPRTLDLDIVRYGDWKVNEPDLVIPHPEIARRDFWRREIAELEAALRGGARAAGRSR